MRRLLSIAALALLGGCASQGDLMRVHYVPHAGLPGPAVSETVKQSFLEGSRAQASSSSLFGAEIGEHSFSSEAMRLYYDELGFRHASQMAAREADWMHSHSSGLLGALLKEDWERHSALWNYNQELKEALKAEGKGSDRPPSPLDIMRTLEAHPYFETGLVTKSGLPAQVIFDYYRIYPQAASAPDLYRVGWREANDAQMADYLQHSGADEAYHTWLASKGGPNTGAKILKYSFYSGAVLGAIGIGALVYSGHPTNGGDGLLLAPFILCVGAGIGGLAAITVMLPFEIAFWNEHGAADQDKARDQFNRYLKKQLQLSFAPQPGGAQLAGSLAW